MGALEPSNLAEFYDVEGGELVVGGVRLSELVEEYGTPLYVYDGDIIRKKYQLLKEALPQFSFYYSIKANSNIDICRSLRELGLGAEIASGGELYLARIAGFQPERIIFAGPGKSDSDLEYAVREGIHAVNAESAHELKRLDRIAEACGRQVRCAIRVNTCGSVKDAPERMAGGPSKFGIDEERLVRSLAELDLGNIDIVGFHVYTASGVLDADELAANTEKILDLSLRFSDELGISLEMIDFGGGFGVPYSPGELPVDIASLARRIDTIIKEGSNSDTTGNNLSGTELIFELGRYLVAESGVYLTKVIDVKESRGKCFAITDGGMNHQIRPVFMDLNHPTYVVNKLDRERDMILTVGGPCCTPIDIFARDISAPSVSPGDIIGLFNSGAYGYSMSMLYFLSHPLPAEVFIHKGVPRLSRRRGSIKDSLLNQVI